jgi:tetratricopeptide (TPR) repeat protein
MGVFIWLIKPISIGGIIAGILLLAPVGYLVGYKDIKKFDDLNKAAISAAEAALMPPMAYYDYVWHNSRGIDYFQKGNYRMAIKAFTKSFEVYPNTGSLNLCATASYYLGDFDSAIDDWELAVEIAPDSTLLRQNLENAKKAREYNPSLKPTLTIEPKQKGISP